MVDISFFFHGLTLGMGASTYLRVNFGSGFSARFPVGLAFPPSVFTPTELLSVEFSLSLFGGLSFVALSNIFLRFLFVFGAVFFFAEPCCC